MTTYRLSTHRGHPELRGVLRDPKHIRLCHVSHVSESSYSLSTCTSVIIFYNAFTYAFVVEFFEFSFAFGFPAFSLSFFCLLLVLGVLSLVRESFSPPFFSFKKNERVDKNMDEGNVGELDVDST